MYCTCVSIFSSAAKWYFSPRIAFCALSLRVKRLPAAAAAAAAKAATTKTTTAATVPAPSAAIAAT